MENDNSNKSRRILMRLIAAIILFYACPMKQVLADDLLSPFERDSILEGNDLRGYEYRRWLGRLGRYDRECQFTPPVIEDFHVSIPSCSAVHDASRPNLSYRVTSGSDLFKVTQVRIIHLTPDGIMRVLDNRIAPPAGAWTTLTGNDIRDPGPINASNASGKFRLIVSSPCRSVSRDIGYRYRLPQNFEIGPNVRESPVAGGRGWRYSVDVLRADNVNDIMVKAPPVWDRFECEGCRDWVLGGLGERSFIYPMKLSDEGVRRIYYRSNFFSNGGACGGGVERSAALTPYSTPEPSPEPEPNGVWWNINCDCRDPYISRNVRIRACNAFSSGFAFTNGFALRCGQLATSVRGGTSCRAAGWQRIEGEGSCVPATWNWQIE